MPDIVMELHSQAADSLTTVCVDDSSSDVVFWVPKNQWAKFAEASKEGNTPGATPNRRISSRERVRQRCMVRVDAHEQIGAVFVDCQDVSQGGVGMVSPMPLPIGSRVHFALRGADGQSLAAVVWGTVAWCRDEQDQCCQNTYRIGVKLGQQIRPEVVSDSSTQIRRSA